MSPTMQGIQRENGAAIKSDGGLRDEISALFRACDDLEKFVSEANEQLAHVARPESPAVAGATTAPPDVPYSPTVAGLRVQRRRIEHLTGSLRYLFSRLDV